MKKIVQLYRIIDLAVNKWLLRKQLRRIIKNGRTWARLVAIYYLAGIVSYTRCIVNLGGFRLGPSSCDC